MMLYALSHSPAESAKMIDDGRVLRALADAIQLLKSVCVATENPISESLPGPYWTKHPLLTWCLEGTKNVEWVCNYGIALAERYGRHTPAGYFEHAWLLHWLLHEIDTLSIPSGTTPFYNATPYKRLHVHSAYVEFMLDRWFFQNRPPQWRGGQTPMAYLMKLGEKGTRKWM